MTSLADLQTVEEGTGKETYVLMKSELESVGCPSWTLRASTPSDNNRFSLFNFCLDNGPDNGWSTKAIKTEISDAPHVAMSVMWCRLHQYHLIVRDVLGGLDEFRFSAQRLEVKYFSALATTINTIRSTGMMTKIRKVAEERFGLEAATAHCGRMPAKCLRGRWGACEQAEEAVMKGGHVLGSALIAVCYPELIDSLDFLHEDAVPLLGVADEDQRQKQKKKWRKVAALAMGNNVFQATVIISRIGKGPLRHFYHWALKRQKEERADRKAAERSGIPHGRPTMISELVTYMAHDIAKEFNDLLKDEFVLDENVWGPVWKFLEGDLRREGLELAVWVVLTGAVGWDFRFLLMSVQSQWRVYKSSLV